MRSDNAPGSAAPDRWRTNETRSPCSRRTSPLGTSTPARPRTPKGVTSCSVAVRSSRSLRRIPRPYASCISGWQRALRLSSAKALSSIWWQRTPDGPDAVLGSGLPKTLDRPLRRARALIGTGSIKQEGHGKC